MTFKLAKKSSFYNNLTIKNKTKFKKAMIHKGTIRNHEIINQFKGIREATSDEIKHFIKTHYKYREFYHFFWIIIFFSCWLSFLLIKTSIQEQNLQAILGNGFKLVIIYFLLFKFYTRIKKEQAASQKVLKSKAYIAECYICNQKRVWVRRDYVQTFIKVWDKQGHYIKKWFLLKNHILYKKNIPNLYLYIFVNDNTYTLELLKKNK